MSNPTSEMPSLWTFPLVLPRHAFSVRDAARAGDLWRAFQEVAVEGSTRAGWNPLRYRGAGSAFIMRTMTVEHGLEALYGEELEARTWVHGFRRDMFSTREVRLDSPRGSVVRGSQLWVHVAFERDGTITPRRAPAELVEAFPPHHSDEPAVELPAIAESVEGKEYLFEVDPWFTWMDPLDHVNHPAYVDFCDEALSRTLHEAGISPVLLAPVAEKVTFTRGLRAREKAIVKTRFRGFTASRDLVFAHSISCDEGLCAKATTVRTLRGSSVDPWVGAVRG